MRPAGSSTPISTDVAVGEEPLHHVVQLEDTLEAEPARDPLVAMDEST